MTTNSTDTNFSYRLTESILSHPSLASTTPNSTLSKSALLKQKSTPRLVSHLPSTAIVFQNQDTDSSFNQYIDNQYKEDAPVFLDRLQVPSYNNHRAKEPKQDSTLWSYLSKDLDNKPASLENKDLEENNASWHEYDSTFAGVEQPLIETSLTLFSLGALLFLFGFLFPPAWWIGSFIPRPKFDENRKMDSRWRLVNRFFSLGFSTLLIVAIIVLVIVYSKTS